MHVWHSGNLPGSRPGTQTLPHKAVTAVPLTIPSTTEFPIGTTSAVP